MTDKVQNMTSNKGNKIANQFVIYTDNGSIFQSYNSTIVKIDSGKIYLDESKWNYSTTTGKYRKREKADEGPEGFFFFMQKTACEVA